MSEADKMFEELGYKKRLHTNIKKEIIELIGYDRSEKDIAVEECSITFLMQAKMITTTIVINMQELQVINEKCKELGWIE